MDRSTHGGDYLESGSRQKDGMETGCGIFAGGRRRARAPGCVNHGAPNARARSPGVSMVY